MIGDAPHEVEKVSMVPNNDELINSNLDNFICSVLEFISFKW